MQWASYQIHKIAGCACAGNAGNVFPRRRFKRKPLVSDPGMHHGTCVTHVPWCMSGSLTCGDGENVPGIPGACAPAILRIWQEAHGDTLHIDDLVHDCSNSSVSAVELLQSCSHPSIWMYLALLIQTLCLLYKTHVHYTHRPYMRYSCILHMQASYIIGTLFFYLFGFALFCLYLIHNTHLFCTDTFHMHTSCVINTQFIPAQQL